MTDYRLRAWVPEYLEDKIARFAAHYNTFSSDAIEAQVNTLLHDHEIYMDHQTINLYAGTNIMNPRAVKLLSSSVGTRPSLGYPGEKYEMGMHHAEKLEIIAVELLKKLFRCDYVEFRVPSGSLANLYAYMACTKPGDTIFAFPDSAAGHVTHHPAGAAGLYGLNVRDVPFDGTTMAIDLEALRQEVLAHCPTLIIIGGSMCLFPYAIAEVRAIADQVGAKVMFDAAHMSGLIAGEEFQQPLAEGAHLMTCSTYKSFGGPPAGLVLTNDASIAERLDNIAYPGLTANFDLSKTAALIIASLDLIEHGKAYAQMCIANAKTLAEALHEKGCHVHNVAGKGFTQSHHVALPAHSFGGGNVATHLLERAHILASGIGLPLESITGDFNAIRLGTQEITRWGMIPSDMPTIASLMQRALSTTEHPESVRGDVVAFRKEFQTLHFIRN